MDQRIRQFFQDREGPDAEKGFAAFASLIEATEGPVDWAYEVWDDLVRQATQGDNHQRAFAAQMLARLALSDPEHRLDSLFPTLFAVTRDERTVTARHALQSVWRVGLASASLRERVIAAMTERFHETAKIKQGTIYRPDIISGLRKLYDATKDEAAQKAAEALAASESDAKAKKKLEAAWKHP